MSGTEAVSIVVPTYRRDEVLVETLQAVLALEPGAAQVVVVDQSPRHDEATASALAALDAAGRIEWLRRSRPSIPAAMNAGLLAARAPVVLFLDDDVRPAPGLVAAHARAHREHPRTLVVGQVLEPGQVPEALSGPEFAFRSSIPQAAGEVIGCHFSVPRELALAVGGFDENFVAVAYRFEAEFGARAKAAGARVHFEPSASVLHLRARRGGVRSYGDHLRTIRPGHAVGEYYFLLRSGGSGALRRLLRRPLRAVRTRHHLRRPWWIPVTLGAELAGWIWAWALHRRGPRTLPVPAAGRSR